MPFIPFFIIIISTVITQSLASGFLGVCGYLFGLLIIKVFYHNDKNLFKKALNSYVVIFTVLIVFSLLRYFDILNNLNYFLRGEDETMFWYESEDAKKYSLRQLIQNDLIDNSYIENGLYYFYIRSLSLFAYNYLDGNHIFYQLIGTSIPAAIASVFFFRILAQHIKENVTKETILFTLLTCLFPLSLIIHRDVLIALAYAFVLYIVICKPLRIKYIISIIVVAFATFFLREQSGLFMILLVAIFVWAKSEKLKGPVALIFLAVVFFSVSALSYVIDTYQTTVEVYMGGKEELLKTSGLSSYVERLPFPLKEIALLIQGQFQPLPIWAQFPEPNRASFYTITMGLIWAIISVYWFRVFVQSFWFFIKKNKHFPRLYKWLYLFFLVFLVMNVSNADPRRMMCMYIVPFSLYVYNKTYVTNKVEIKNFDIFYYSGVTLLMLAVLLLKM